MATKPRALIRQLIPDAVEEIDTTARMVGFSSIPGTYKGLIMSIAPQRTYVNLMFSKGVELMSIDAAGSLEGTGKRARHIKPAV